MTRGVSVTRLVIGSLLLVLVATGLLAARTGSDDIAGPGVRLASDSTARLGSTRWRMATFNVLGSGHTDYANPDTPGYETGEVRMGYTVKIIGREKLSLVGFQEMRRDQYDEFNRLTGSAWDIWPQRPATSSAWDARNIANSIAWRTDTWEVVRRDSEPIRYINDDVPVDYPVVWLRHRLTGQMVITANFHNVSNVWDAEIEGGAEARRAEEVEAEIALANRLRTEFPDIPVLFTGDFNERASFFCKIASRTKLRAANGGAASATWCRPPAEPMPVDWILGSAPATLSGWAKLWNDDPLVQKATDHPVVVAEAAVPPSPAVTAPIDHVVVISVEGLRSRIVGDLGSKATGFYRLKRYGSSTSNARPVERPLSLSNVASLFTGRPINPTINGHGVVDGRPPTTVHASAGGYVRSVFDVLHDRGLTTTVVTNDAAARVFDRSWDATNGAPDTYWADNGRDKISRFVVGATPGSTAKAIHDELSRSTPSTFTYGQLSGADVAGHKYGFNSSQYQAEVVRVAGQVNAVIDVVRTNPALRDRTLLVVTGEHGGWNYTHTRTDLLANVQIPLYVFGPTVPRGYSLYGMNPDYRDPGNAISSYTGPQPIRPSLVPSLVTAVLDLPAVPGSTMNTQQNFNVFGSR